MKRIDCCIPVVLVDTDDQIMADYDRYDLQGDLIPHGYIRMGDPPDPPFPDDLLVTQEVFEAMVIDAGMSGAYLSARVGVIVEYSYPMREDCVFSEDCPVGYTWRERDTDILWLDERPTVVFDGTEKYSKADWVMEAIAADVIEPRRTET